MKAKTKQKRSKRKKRPAPKSKLRARSKGKIRLKTKKKVNLQIAGLVSVAGPRFVDVKTILDRLVSGRSVARMKVAHGDPSFGWTTLSQLKAVVVRPGGPGTEPSYPLIDPALVGNGKGNQTNLVVALSNVTGVDFNGQMPLDGPYSNQADIQTIIDWIDAGMPE